MYDNTSDTTSTLDALKAFYNEIQWRHWHVKMACEKFARDPLVADRFGVPRSLQDWEELAGLLLPADRVLDSRYTLQNVHYFARIRARDELDKAKLAAASAEAENKWISFDEAKNLTALKSYEISRACKSGKVRSQGERKGRQVHLSDLVSFMAKRSDNCH